MLHDKKKKNSNNDHKKHFESTLYVKCNKVGSKTLFKVKRMIEPIKNLSPFTTVFDYQNSIWIDLIIGHVNRQQCHQSSSEFDCDPPHFQSDSTR